MGKKISIDYRQCRRKTRRSYPSPGRKRPPRLGMRLRKNRCAAHHERPLLPDDYNLQPRQPAVVGAGIAAAASWQGPAGRPKTSATLVDQTGLGLQLSTTKPGQYIGIGLLMEGRLALAVVFADLEPGRNDPDVGPERHG